MLAMFSFFTNYVWPQATNKQLHSRPISTLEIGTPANLSNVRRSTAQHRYGPRGLTRCGASRLVPAAAGDPRHDAAQSAQRRRGAADYPLDSVGDAVCHTGRRRTSGRAPGQAAWRTRRCRRWVCRRRQRQRGRAASPAKWPTAPPTVSGLLNSIGIRRRGRTWRRVTNNPGVNRRSANPRTGTRSAAPGGAQRTHRDEVGYPIVQSDRDGDQKSLRRIDRIREAEDVERLRLARTGRPVVGGFYQYPKRRVESVGQRLPDAQSALL